MSLTFDFKSLSRPLVTALIDTQWEALKADVAAAVKQGGSAISDLFADDAASLADKAGGTAEEWLKVILDYAMSKLGPEAPAEEPPAAEMMPEDGSMTLSADVEKLIDAKVEKRVQALLPSAPAGGALTSRRNPAIVRPVASEHSVARLLKAVLTKDSDYLRTSRRARYDSYVKRFGQEWTLKALGTSPDTAGGYLLESEHAAEIIDYLYDVSVMSGLVTTRPMASKTLDITRVTGGVNVGWVGENTQLADQTDPTFGIETLVAKKMYAKVYVSNEELDDAGPEFETWLRNSIAGAMAQEFDRVILRGSGIAVEPLGILNRPGVTATALNAVPTYANLVGVQTRLKQSKIQPDNSLAWVVNPRDTGGLRLLEDTAGNLIWTGSQGQGSDLTKGQPDRLLNWPVKETNQLDIDATDNNETEMFGGKWSDVVVGMRKTVEIKADESIRFDYDQIAFRAIIRMDVGMYRDESIEILTDVRTS